LGAIGTIYLSVTPRLEASLTSQRLNGLVADSRRYVTRLNRELPVKTYPPLPGDATAKERKQRDDLLKRQRERLDGRGRRGADAAGTEILLYTAAELGPYLVTDSKPGGGVKTEDVRDLAGRAMRLRREVSETGATSGGVQAMVAQPIFDDDKKVLGAAV